MSLVLSVLYVFLFVFHGVEAGNAEEKVLEEDENVTLQCATENTGIVYWLRLNENAQGFEYIATYSIRTKGKESKPDKFKVDQKSLKVMNFKQEEDSGSYSCVSINNNELRFSGTTKLRRKTVPTIKPIVEPTRGQTIATTTKGVVTCKPNYKGSTHAKVDALWGCELRIFIPLAAGCGVLLLILIITIVHCNRIRTRRCPHHHKRQPRSRPGGHKTLPNPLNY